MTNTIFSTQLKRAQLLTFKPNSAQKAFRVHIYRNAAFEPIERVLGAFLAASNLRAQCSYSDYDDSLSFANTNAADAQSGISGTNALSADIMLLFIDCARYSIIESSLVAFLQERLSYLSAQAPQVPIIVLLLDESARITPLLESSMPKPKSPSAPIIYMDILAACKQRAKLASALDSINATESSKESSRTIESSSAKTQPHTNTLDTESSANAPFLDTKESITGTRLSNAATLALAQILGLRILPSLLLPNLKAIVCDLDNTLYSGVLGEDGAQNLLLTPAHIALQEQILSLKKQGYLLAIASKNQMQDVANLFRQRRDFPLKLSDFDNVQAHWQSKASSLESIAKAFNIGLDSMLFIDDNIAEIKSIQHTHAHTIHATSVQYTLWQLFLYPRLQRFFSSSEDMLRSSDIAANTAREQLRALSDEEYFRSLEIELTFSVNDFSQTQRIYELLNKTNQFIANYTRPSLSQVQQWLESKDYCVVCIGMKDKLSESGVIGIVVGSINCSLDSYSHKEQSCIEIVDITISCRALGRRLEALFLQQSFALIVKHLTQKATHKSSTQKIARAKKPQEIKEVLVHFQKGERNTPFLHTLENLNNGTLNAHSPIAIPLSLPPTQGISIIIKEQE
ncbi:HAD-IIIC family phosphatase [Helicobacter jaachi]|uniref:HAD-IIIC family phosphatase n=1 Tax=Helicobacter jaachi TaxID=1677920 RepID=A0A4U8T9Q7_9HELI|nr:HAD-IIIC family phosphatase [Helicobacter jaachi]TLD96495.1 HAD-IIIC family phosphatase [Helicobacter jaachi]